MARTEHEAPPTIIHDTGFGATLDRFFQIAERGSSIRTEMIAGLATFLTMAYILFLNPAILGAVTDSPGRAARSPGAHRDRARRRRA